jgi:hypothetical protein
MKSLLWPDAGRKVPALGLDRERRLDWSSLLIGTIVVDPDDRRSQCFVVDRARHY